MALAGAIEAAGPGARVPSCPDWSAADLCYHLYEVQSFWATIVEGRLGSADGIDEPSRPGDAALPDALRAAARRLVAALRAADPSETVWTWADDKSLAWVARRQAHEALIHRVDGELAAGVDSSLDSDLAADGVQELVDWFFGTAPAWATFVPLERVRLVRTDGPGEWYLAKGRFTGTGPESGNEFDMVTVLAGGPGDADAEVRGAAAALDLWLWGRADRSALEVVGDEALADFVREDAVGLTQ